jgi:hypothetical protein
MELVLKKEQASNEYVLLLTESSGKLHFRVNHSGCVEAIAYMNDSRHGSIKDQNDVDFIHICDLGEFCDALKLVREMADMHFDGWPE